MKKLMKWKLKPHAKTNKASFYFEREELPYWTSPTGYEIREVVNLLAEERMALQADSQAALTPAHAAKGLTMDSVVRVILSQALSNEVALDIQQALIHAYPYEVNGKIIEGTIPNYHEMRLQSLTKLSDILSQAGLQNIKAVPIMKCLEMVYAKNVARLMDRLGVDRKQSEVVHSSQDPTARDFVPGLLSMDYVQEIYDDKKQEVFKSEFETAREQALKHGMSEGEANDKATMKAQKACEIQALQAVFDELTSLPQVGVKTASCLMSFNMGLPVFAVDTHVAAMAKLLG
jgi:endonuclease III